MKNIVIIGASGAIGQALIRHLSSRYNDATIHACARARPNGDMPQNVVFQAVDYKDEASIAEAAAAASQDYPLDLVIVATGILHDGDIMPEKSLKELSADKFHHIFQVNTVVPALIAKHFLPRLNSGERSIFAALSARVGSISDNHLGGWYAYRASKAALNMILKNAAIETARRNKNAIIVGLHPGTVDSKLSQPFQQHVPEGKLFSPDFAATKLVEVLGRLTAEQSGKCFAWDGEEVQP